MIQKISEDYPDWGISERQIDNYIKGARELIRNQLDPSDLILEKDIALSRMDSLYVMNMKIQDYRECRNLVNDRMKLLGISIDKSELNVKDERSNIIVKDQETADAIKDL